MIFSTREPMPQPILPRSTYQSAPPCACGGRIVAQLVPLWGQRYPGEVEYRCDACRTVETAQERAAKERAYVANLAALKQRQCAREGCGNPVDSLGRTYCGRRCASMVVSEVREATRPAREAKARRAATVGSERACACGCGRTFRVARIVGQPRRYATDACRVRQYNQNGAKVERERLARRAKALEQLRRFFERTGRAPTRDEMGLKSRDRRDHSVPAGSSLKHYFGSIAAALALAGIPSRGAGEHLARAA